MSAESELRAQIEALAAEPAYRNYLEVRERVLAMLDGAGSDGVNRPSGYWREELAELEHMFDASPLVIDRLRHHCYLMTGLKPYDYRSGKDACGEQLRARLEGLIALGGEDLFVPEATAVGGFGFESPWGLFNADTLKYYEAAIALDRGAVLSPFRDPSSRRVVWEIGGGWGGLAYTFKQLAPSTCYVITDLPQAFLFSAVYLMSALPEARVAFHGDGPIEDLVASSDFVFTPNWALEELALPQLDLTINMVSFQEMTDAQVAAYVDKAWDLGSSYLYSYNRDASRYNEEISSVAEIVERRFWPHEIPIDPAPPLPEDLAERKRARAEEKQRRAVEKRREGYRHIVGWPREREAAG